MNKKKVAVIGAGIAGLSSAFFLSKKYDLVLLEKNDYLGGHTRTKTIHEENKLHKIDTGFIVFNNQNYSDLKKFFEILDVKSGNSNMSFSISLRKNNFEYGGANIKSLFAQPKNIFSIKFLLLILEIKKLYKFCTNFSLNSKDHKLTIDEFLDKYKYSQDIRNLHIYPILSSIWSTQKNKIKDFPFISFLNFFKNHGLFNLQNRPQWKYVKGGSQTYVKKVLNNKFFDFKTNCLVTKIIREKEKILIKIKNGKDILVDKIVLATHADQSLSMLESPTQDEKKILSCFKYTNNEAYLHSDHSFMPKNKNAWSSWNFIGDDLTDTTFSMTYWMNKLQEIDSKKEYFVTINPKHQPHNFYDYTIFEHPTFNLSTIEAQKRIFSIQGYLNTYYCGSYCGYGFHEDSIQSAAYIAKKLNINLPWNRDENFQNRLYYYN